MVARVRLDSRALRGSGTPADAPLLLSRAAWGSEVELPDEAPDVPELIADGVALVVIEGPLAREPDTLCGWYDGYDGADGIAARVARALASPDVAALVVSFDSPGGTSAGLEEAIARMIAARDASGKPVIGHVKQACSAAMWIAACLCDGGLYGGISSEAGSIGSYVVHSEYSEALKMEGETVTVIADPPGKTAGNPWEPLSELGRSRIEQGVKDCTRRFYAAMEGARGLTTDVLIELNGAVLEGSAAVTQGLLDGLADFETVIQLALARVAERAGKAS